jgi:hypothetical protein
VVILSDYSYIHALVLDFILFVSGVVW